jgi:hypothetical protein
LRSAVVLSAFAGSDADLTRICTPALNQVAGLAFRIARI